MWFMSVCQSLRVIEDNCSALSEELRAFSLDSWTGHGSEGARAEIDAIRAAFQILCAHSTELRHLAEIEWAALGGH